MESIAFDLRQTQRQPLADSHIAEIRAAGVPRTYPAGTFIAQQGETVDRFILVESGEVEVVDAITGLRKLPPRWAPASSWAKSPSSQAAAGRCRCAPPATPR